MKPRSSITTVIGVLGILGCGVAIFFYFIRTSPTTEPKDHPRQAKIVQTLIPAAGTQSVRLTAFGTVIPSRQVTIQPEIRGRVVWQSDRLVLGGRLQIGEPLLRVNTKDYELALVQAQTGFEEARSELEIEQGRQVVAAREWNLLKGDLADTEVNRSLVLRQPHLRGEQASVLRATNDIDRARLNLDRCEISVPFNALVLEESVEIGQLVDPGTRICTLAGTDAYWIRASLPVDQLHHIRLPSEGHPGAAARVVLDGGDGPDTSWRGQVVRLLGDVEPTGRMARVLLEVQNPLGDPATRATVPLLLGSYVRVEIEVGALEKVIRVPRHSIREGGRIWVVDGENRLRIREADVQWAEQDHLLIRDVLEEGEQLIVSGLKNALPGMEVDPQPLPGTGGSDRESRP